MKLIFLIGMVSATVTGFSQTRELKTTTYAGMYSIEGDVEKGAVGRTTIYPETDSTVLFFIDLCKGGGSSSVGQLYSRLTIRNGQGIYYSKKNTDRKGCKWKVTIDKNNLTIKTLDDCYDCGLGIHADNLYKRKMNIVPAYFTNGDGRKVYFDKTSPEDYLK